MAGNSEPKANKPETNLLAGERRMSGKEKLVVWLEDVRNTDIPIVGGKGASLGEMINAELPVPRGFVVTAQAFRKFIDDAGIADRLFKGLEVDVDDQIELAVLPSLQGCAPSSERALSEAKLGIQLDFVPYLAPGQRHSQRRLARLFDADHRYDELESFGVTRHRLEGKR